MASHDSHVAAYRRLVRLYPAPFRAEYGDDMADLFAAQIADEPAARVWARTVKDLAATVPRLHMEASMRDNAKTVAFVAFAALAVLFAPRTLWLLVALVLFGVWRALDRERPEPMMTWQQTVKVGLFGGAACLAVGVLPASRAVFDESFAYGIGILGVVGGTLVVLTGLVRGVHAKRSQQPA
jgi:hypothetical protein